MDSAGKVWFSQFAAGRVARLGLASGELSELAVSAGKGPRRGAFDVFPLPGTHAMVRGMAVDREGRLWYVGSVSGRLGRLDLSRE